ncbi:proteasome assembly chaperone family protein [Candidatus Lokiarchaeum ossiferum]
MTQKLEKIDPTCVPFLEGKLSRIVIDDAICENLKSQEKPPLFIIGFAGVGLIGTILANELVEQLKMKQIGHVLSEDLPPITVFYDGVLKHPFRLYYQEKFNLVVSLCEVPFNPGSYSDLARTLMNWALSQGIQDVLCVQGMADESIAVRDTPSPVFAAAEEEILEKILAHGVKRPPKGLIMGAEAAILNECLNNQLNGAVFLTPANPHLPSPEGAASILEKMSDVYGFPIKLDGLLKQSSEIKQRLLELQKQTNNVHSQNLPIAGRNIYS